MTDKIIYGDSIEVMETLPDKSVNMVLADLPYGVTRNKWDSVIPLPQLWGQYKRIIIGNGAIILTACQPFTSALVMSNLAMFKYALVWQKTHATGFLNAKRAPLRSHEDILIFSAGQTVYNPQKTTGHKRKVSTATHGRNSKATTNYGAHGPSNYDSTERYPKSVLTFKLDKQKSSLVPTQKPLGLMEYLIRTYSNPGDVVLDNTCGSGTTGVACIRTGRSYIMIDNDMASIDIATERIKNIHDLP